MSDRSEDVADALDSFAEQAAAVARKGGRLSMGALAAAAILKAAAKVTREHGEPVEVLLERLKRPRELHLPWSKPAEPHDATSITRAESPKAKRKE